MKRLVLMLIVASLAGAASANCGNDNGNGNGCSGNTGPQGPAGPQGLTGQNGNDGTNGKDGVKGDVGAVGPAAPVRAAMIGGLELRLFDTRYISMAVFDDYQFDPLPGHDLIGGGARNSAYGARLTFKLGRDYTEERIDELEKKLHRLEALAQ